VGASRVEWSCPSFRDVTCRYVDHAAFVLSTRLGDRMARGSGMDWQTVGLIALWVVAAPFAYRLGRWMFVRRLKSGRLR
jgi:hypothetical protein